MYRFASPVVAVALLFATGCTTGSSEKSASSSVADADAAAVRAFMDKVQQTFNGGDLDAFMPAFADDAIVIGQGQPDVAGKDAIRAMYADAMQKVKMEVKFNTEEVQVLGDYAYEREPTRCVCWIRRKETS